MNGEIELVGKIGSMALIDRENNDIDHNLFARLGKELRPGWVWVTSGATEVGRIDYMDRTGRELDGLTEDVKADYAAQGQTILMRMYRRYVDARYSVRQVLVEHQHFNDPEKSEFLKKLLLRAAEQNAVPIVNYNDAVSAEENRKNEIRLLEKVNKHIVECVDNDETAAQIAVLVKAKTLLILTSADGIYSDPKDSSTLIEEIRAGDADSLIAKVDDAKACCKGASRAGAGGARAKLEYVKEPLRRGTTVIIANAKKRISDILAGREACTRIGLKI